MGTMWMLLRWAAAAVAAVTVQKWVVKSVQLERKLAETEAALKVARRERTAERTGRIRAQRVPFLPLYLAFVLIVLIIARKDDTYW